MEYAAVCCALDCGLGMALLSQSPKQSSNINAHFIDDEVGVLKTFSNFEESQ